MANGTVQAEDMDTWKWLAIITNMGQTDRSGAIQRWIQELFGVISV